MVYVRHMLMYETSACMTHAFSQAGRPHNMFSSFSIHCSRGFNVGLATASKRAVFAFGSPLFGWIGSAQDTLRSLCTRRYNIYWRS